MGLASRLDHTATALGSVALMPLKHIASLAARSALYTRLRPNQSIDERGRVLLEGCIPNVVRDAESWEGRGRE
jgi:hypothetical protein